MKYNYKKIENKWYKIHNNINFLKFNRKKKNKFYILNMFPYPSGSGIHIGHSIGYIFADIISKYKLLRGYNVLNPIGFDSFGLPAEQYALRIKKLPQKIVKVSIKKYKKQIKKLAVFFNWEKEINTSNPKYYKWTQYIFIKLFNSFYDHKQNKARNIKFLYKKNKNKYRLAYLKKNFINWCPKLNSVLANDEVDNGRSIRGGYKVFPKLTKEWHLRITKYIPRLLNDYKFIKWPTNIINYQKKWIGQKSVYKNTLVIKKNKINFCTLYKNKKIRFIVFKYPSRYLFFLLHKIKKNKKRKILNILNKLYLKKKFKISIEFIQNINKNFKIYISNFFKNFYINDVYVGYKKNNKFDKIKNTITIKIKIKIKILFNFKKETIYNLKDIVFSRQRYWGEPIPIFYKNNIPHNIYSKFLPLKLPKISNKFFIKKKFNLKSIKKWSWDNINNKITYNKYTNKKNVYKLDTNTMPSIAASNWYYLRYLSPKYNKFLFNKKDLEYWGNVDLYIGGAEHTTGHLLYSRFCTKFFKDLGYIKFREPFQNFIQQGIILNTTYIYFKIKNKIISYDIVKKKKIELLVQGIYIDKKYILNNKYLDINNPKFNKLNFIKNKNNKILCRVSIEKMSKSKLNFIKPEKIIKKYGIDSYRLYLMFLGPFSKKKIWSIDKINGIKRFLNKVWNHYLIKKDNKINTKYLNQITGYINEINSNLNNFLLHKNISVFMQIFNILTKNNIYNYKLNKRILILFSIYAPYISEEIWQNMGGKKSIFYNKLKSIGNVKKKIKYFILVNNKFREQLFLDNKNNNYSYIVNHVKNKKYFNNIKIKKIIFIKNKVINVLT